MSLNEPIYTDVLKDIIGNDPVLDQFDIFYEASYYKTSQDDYVTGSILDKRLVNNKLQLVTGSRGRAFSKFYAESAPPLDSTYGSSAVNKNPSLSYRLIPNFTRVSTTAYRIVQAYDANERYYDSCLPNLGEIFKNSGAKIWSIRDNNRVFSPYGNFVTSSVGYLFFDSMEFDYTGYEKDPTTVNDWTRSFPYEPRYSPELRTISTDNLLGLNKAELSTNWGPIKYNATIPTIEFVGFGPAVTKTFDTTVDVLKNEDIHLKNLSQVQENLLSFIPVIPGYVEPKSGENFKNSLRSRFSLDGGYGEVYINSANYADSALDKENGYSLLLLSDVDLSKKISNESGLQYVTGSSYANDLTKFMFGFGDLNNVTYGRRTYDSSKKFLRYTEDFSGISNKTLDDNISSNRGNSSFRTNWKSSLWHNILNDLGAGAILGTGFNPWRVAEADSTSGGISFKEGRAGFGTSNGGISWSPDSLTGNILVSSTNNLRSGLNASNVPSGSTGMNVVGSTSNTFLEVTSSYPWSLSFDRAVCGTQSDKLKTWVAYSNGLYTSFFWTLDEVSGSGSSTETMKTYDFSVSGSLQGDPENKDYPLPPGNWTIWWQFMSGSSTNNSIPSFAAISNLKFYSFDGFEKTSMIGSNNLPEFRAKLSDGRINPQYSSSMNTSDYGLVGSAEEGKYSAKSYFLSGSSEIYNSYVSGISPLIRGWKYGLISGFPTHSKCVFRRGRYGQLRDMLEQRQYSKFVSVNSSPVDDDAVTNDGFNKDLNGSLSNQSTSQFEVGPAATEVKFVKKVARISPRGIGTFETRSVLPEETTSQNLSKEATSSLPYFDDDPKNRTREDAESIARSSFVDTVIVQVSDQGLGL